MFGQSLGSAYGAGVGNVPLLVSVMLEFSALQVAVTPKCPVSAVAGV
jgi:hypothetical protein